MFHANRPATIPLAALGLTAALALAGCGGSGNAASGGGGGGSSDSGKSQDQMVKYAQCLRKHGIDVQDPKPGQKGIRITARNRSGGNGRAMVPTSKMTKAQKACRRYVPDKVKAANNDPKFKDQMVKFAKCMREHGIDMPDPSSGGGIKMKRKEGDGPQFKKAMKACQDKMPGKMRQHAQ